MLEIGPGQGALTRLAADRAGWLIGVELDELLAARLRERQLANVEVVHADFIDYPLPERNYKLIGNLPYAFTTDIIHKITTSHRPPAEAWTIVQKEAAHRFAGRPYRNETLWSLRLKPWWHIEIVDRLARNDFDPPPSIDSVMIWLVCRAPPLVHPDHEARYRQLIERAFSGGDTIGKALGQWLTKRQMRRLAADLRFDPADRPPKLSFEQWLGILRFVTRP